jgi:outer membrane protein
VRAGAVSRLDSLQAQVDLARRAAAEIRAREAVRLARVDLEAAIGAPLAGDALVEPGEASSALPETEAAVERAFHSRPELAAYDAQLLESAFQLEAARAARQPQVTLGATAQYLGPNREESYWDDQAGLRTYKFFASVGLTMPLFDGGLVAARAGQVAARREELAAQRRQTELDVRGQVEHALADARVAHTVWQSDSSRVAAAREALKIAEAGYKGGTSTSTDVRDAVAALADARAEEAQSLMEYWTARAALDHATGATAKQED